jgi:hypothetical protein
MSFSEKWNARIIWLRDLVLTPFGAIWAEAKTWPVVSIVGVAVALFSVYFYKTPIQNMLNHAEDGKIIVNSPTVYTRQRLVNDRLDQARWLRTQLEFTEKEREKDFKSIDQLNNVYSNTQANLGEGSGDKKIEKPVPSSISVEATTTAQFRAKNTYREEVRSEITQTELDDRHDIRGNTIFRLAFDASILAGTRRGSVAGIGIKLNHRPESAKDANKIVYDDDYRSLYEDWARYFQDTIRKSLSIVPKSIMSPDPIPQLRILFTEFLLRRICQFSRNDPDLTKDPTICEKDERRDAEALLADYSKTRFGTLQGFRLNGFVGAVEGYANSGYTLPPGNVVLQPAASMPISSTGSNPNTTNSQVPPLAALSPDDNSARLQKIALGLAPLISAATRACAEQQKVEIALWELKIIPPASKPISGPSTPSGEPPVPSQTATGPSQRAANSDARRAGRPTEQNRATQQSPGHSNPSDDRIACPFYDSLSERLVSGILLYENLLSLAMAREQKQVIASDAKVRRDHVLEELKNCDRGACQVSPARLRCFSADFVKSNLNSFHDKNVDEQQKIKHYLNLQIVGRDVNDCNILVAAHAGDADDPAGKTYSPLTKFIERLNRGTDAFAYSVTPKNLTENISTAAETRDAFELMFRAAGDNKQIANLLQQRSEQNQAIVAHPIVVGFGTPSDARQIQLQGNGVNTTTSGIRDIDFGWIVAPRSRVAGDLEQIDGQYSLTAFISVPAWWRTVEVDINVCWLSRTSLAELRVATDICPKTQLTKPNAVTVRLPSAIPEISRKLGFDVVQQPSLYEPREKELIVGAPGALLLEGARLWRSTEVTAGSQRAEKISVLPNMEGILAEFKCVLPPAGQRQTRQNKQVDDDETQIITMDFVRVWTSEGVTEPIPLVFVWPDEWESLLANCQNPQPSQTAAQATSKAAALNAKQNSTPNAVQPPAGNETKAPSAVSVTPPANPPPDPSATTPSAKPSTKQ